MSTSLDYPGLGKANMCLCMSLDLTSESVVLFAQNRVHTASEIAEIRHGDILASSTGTIWVVLDFRC